MSLVVTAARASAIAESNSAYVRAARARRNSLTLDQQFSIGEKSGEVRGQVDDCCPYRFNSLTDTSNFVKGKLSMIAQAPGQRLGTKTCATYVLKANPSVAPGKVISPTSPRSAIAPINVKLLPRW